MLSLCFVAPTAWPVLAHDPNIPLAGGADVQQAILARLFAAKGNRVSMLCHDFGQPALARVDGVEVHRIFARNAGVPVVRFVHPRLTSMWRALKAANADIYYFRTAAMWLGVLAEFCRRHGKGLVFAGASDKDFEPDMGGQIALARDRWLYRRGIERAGAIVAQNETQRASCLATYGREAIVIPSCYVPPASAAQAGSRDIVLWVGTLREGKRPELFLDLAARLPQRRFVMIGGPSANGTLYEAMRARAARLANVEFKGFLPVHEAEPWFDRARVLVNTSQYEGMPNTFMQAWARGVPTVATVDVGAPVHRVALSIDALAREVEFCLHNPGVGEACRDYFNRTHSSAEVMRRYESVFRGVLA